MIPTPAGPLYSLQTEELVLKCHPDLVDCTVVGVPAAEDERSAPVPVLLAIPRDGRRVDAAALLQKVNHEQAVRGRPPLACARLADRGEIPLGVTGKVLKRELRNRLMA
jgi:acyl-coenzyme A synthetase/AMP-(fatty) acid ligase